MLHVGTNVTLEYVYSERVDQFIVDVSNVLPTFFFMRKRVGKTLLSPGFIDILVTELQIINLFLGYSFGTLL